MEQETEEEQIARKGRAHAEMVAAGVATDGDVAQVDYFGFDETFSTTLPDGRSSVQHKTLNEGARRRYMNQMNREVRLQKSGDAFMKMATGDERHVLLEQAMCGWNLVTANKTGELIPISFTSGNLKKFLENAPPDVVDVIEKDVRAKNSWLTGDVTIDDIDAQIEELNELRETKVAEESGNVS